MEPLQSKTTSGQSRPGSNGNEGVFDRFPELEFHPQMQFSVILMIPL